MSLSIGICGVGRFATNFIPLFQAHPLVGEVVLADLLPDRLEEQARRFGVARTYGSLEELCATDVDAVAIFTQRHLHGSQSAYALRQGKHVYCTVPIAQTLEEIREIVDIAEGTGLTYMTGETSYYYPSTLYCRKRFARGDFGHFVYGEARYLHDMSHGFYESFQHSGGTEWKRVAGFPPMLYPTHSVSMILSVTGARVTHVACLGWQDRHEDGIFRVGGNLWDNVFSNETALMRTSDGGMCRINEFRRVGWRGMNSVQMSIFGTAGCFEEQANSQVWVGLKKEDMTDLNDLLRCQAVPVIEDQDQRDLHEAFQADLHRGVSRVHPVRRLPREFAGLPNGHSGSHQFLVDDFLKAVTRGKLPPNHVWAAAKYCAPGLVAHESAKREGEMLLVPDFGEPPPGCSILDPEFA